MENNRAFIIFIALVVVVYSAWNFYLFRRITIAAALTGGYGWALNAALLFIMICFPLAEIFSRKMGIFGSIPAGIGGFWLGVMVYGLLLAVTIDLFRLSDVLFHWLPHWLTADKVKTGRMILGFSAAGITALLITGWFAALNPKIREVRIHIAGIPAGLKGYRIAMFSDVHIGALVGEKRVAKIAAEVNRLQPDLILIAGDLFDEHPAHLKQAAAPLKSLIAPDGIFAVTGNHEHYIGAAYSKQMMKELGIELLRDEVRVIEGRLNLIGLDDITGHQQFRLPIAPVAELMKNTDESLPTVLLHHTPVRIVEAKDAGVDLMVSGHTHGGQLFPGNWVAYIFYRVKSGLTRFGEMNFYLTNGAGVWGSPVRIGAPPEIVLFILDDEE